MHIAFYAPMKSPHHPVPSGDRLMAQLLMQALKAGGHRVELISEFRSYASLPEQALIMADRAQKERQRLFVQYGANPPDLWFCYHPYYKSPDYLGPILCREWDIPYVTAEASYSPKRDQMGWKATQGVIADALALAAVNLCLTGRDQKGLQAAIPQARCASLHPFIDTQTFAKLTPCAAPSRLITVAMMREGDKFNSYTMLAQALKRIEHQPWTLQIVGDGPLRQQVEALFSDFKTGRIEFCGEKTSTDIAALLSEAGIYVWPGCGEAYGLAYLEAQAAGLPVVAQHTAGVPEVVRHHQTGILTEENDLDAYAKAIATLLEKPTRRDALGQAARQFVLIERSLEKAAHDLNEILQPLLEQHHG